MKIKIYNYPNNPIIIKNNIRFSKCEIPNIANLVFVFAGKI